MKCSTLDLLKVASTSMPKVTICQRLKICKSESALVRDELWHYSDSDWVVLAGWSLVERVSLDLVRTMDVVNKHTIIRLLLLILIGFVRFNVHLRASTCTSVVKDSLLLHAGSRKKRTYRQTRGFDPENSDFYRLAARPTRPSRCYREHDVLRVALGHKTGVAAGSGRLISDFTTWISQIRVSAEVNFVRFLAVSRKIISRSV